MWLKVGVSLGRRNRLRISLFVNKPICSIVTKGQTSLRGCIFSIMSFIVPWICTYARLVWVRFIAVTSFSQLSISITQNCKKLPNLYLIITNLIPHYLSPCTPPTNKQSSTHNYVNCASNTKTCPKSRILSCISNHQSSNNK